MTATFTNITESIPTQLIPCSALEGPQRSEEGARATWSIEAKADRVITWLMLLMEQGYPINTACSFGKDSTAVLVLMLEAMRRCIANGRAPSQCYVSHANTLIENPAMGIYADIMLESLEAYAEQHDLPLNVVKATPSISSSFVYATIGRGKLPRFVNSAHRECSVDWKVRPQQKALKAVMDHVGYNTIKPLVTLLGTRSSESASRGARMAATGAGEQKLIQQDNGSYTNACIADWEMADVWELLMACDTKRQGLYASFVEDFDWLLKLYKDANEGTCSIVTGDGGNKAACGSRFGCAFCTVTGDRDKSMEAMIAGDDEYANLTGVNKFRNLLIKTQYDLSKRDWAGRTISKAGFARVRPDNYSSMFRRQLLRYLLTLDANEQARAEDHAEDLAIGAIADTPANQRLAETQFQFVTPQLLIAVDLAWSVQRDFDHAFPAIREWYEIYEMGKRYEIPDVQHASKVDIPESRWFHVGSFDERYGVDGLRDIYGEAANVKRKPGTVPYMNCKDPVTGLARRIIPHEVAEELEIDPVEANLFVTCEYESLYHATTNSDSKHGLFVLLDRGYIKLGAGQAAKYDFMARRGQYYTRLKAQLNIAHLKAHLLANSISDEAHCALLDVIDTERAVQRDLFITA